MHENVLPNCAETWHSGSSNTNITTAVVTIFVLISTIKHFLFISIVVAAYDAAVVVVVVDIDDAVVHQA